MLRHFFLKDELFALLLLPLTKIQHLVVSILDFGDNTKYTQEKCFKAFLT